FATRPRGSQIGAWASRQSEPLGSREELEARVQEFQQKFAGSSVPRPPFWSGFRIVPEQIEFWERREDRLHERVLYVRQDNAWAVRFLYP
ncbi:MAG: pyridoxamine 5'-phosphate oxidase, partial [Calditrichaeota bacterium]